MQKHLEDNLLQLRCRWWLGAMEKMGELLFNAGFKMVQWQLWLVRCAWQPPHPSGPRVRAAHSPVQMGYMHTLIIMPENPCV